MQRRVRWFRVLPFLLILPGCGGDEAPTSVVTTTTTTTPRAPGCTITANPVLARCSQETELTIKVTGGPADGSFSTPKGTCAGFRNVSEAKCKFRTCDAGKTTMTFLVSNANGGSSCFVDAYGAHLTMQVINLSSGAKYSDGDGRCIWIARGGAVDTNYMEGYPVITLYGLSPSSLCSGAKPPTSNRMTFDDAIALDSPLNGGDFDGLVTMNPKGET